VVGKTFFSKQVIDNDSSFEYGSKIEIFREIMNRQRRQKSINVAMLKSISKIKSNKFPIELGLNQIILIAIALFSQSYSITYSLNNSTQLIH